jgi:catechol 2,3-dioxygenase-like lactoylglutathione lyase family enzyme
MITGAMAQLRTTDLEGSIAFWTERVGLPLAFRYRDFYAGIGAGASLFHLKRVDAADPSIAWVRAGEHLHLYLMAEDAAQSAAEMQARGVVLATPPHETAWGTREFVFRDDQGHTIHVGEIR